MKCVAFWATGLLLALAGPSGAFAVNPGDNFPRRDAAAVTSGATGSDLQFDTSAQIVGNTTIALPQTLNDSVIPIAQNKQDSSTLKPEASSGLPAAVPAPRAGLIELFGVLGVIYLRWHSSRRTRVRAGLG